MNNNLSEIPNAVSYETTNDSLRFCNHFTALLLIYAGYKTLKYFEHTFFCNRQNGGFDTSKGPKKWGKDMW